MVLERQTITIISVEDHKAFQRTLDKRGLDGASRAVPVYERLKTRCSRGSKDLIQWEPAQETILLSNFADQIARQTQQSQPFSSPSCQ